MVAVANTVVLYRKAMGFVNIPSKNICPTPNKIVNVIIRNKFTF